VSGRARITLYWAIVAVTFGFYTVMMLGTLPRIAADAGSPALDLRLSGYSADAARAFLGALSDEGRALYLNVQRRLDTVYPVLLCVIACWSIVWATRGVARWVTVLLIVSSVLGMLCDLTENARIAAMLRLPPGAVTDAQIAQASILTQAKALLTVWPGLVVVPLVVRRVFFRRDV